MSETLRFLSAGAGSGKTHRLTEILHDMLIDRQVRASGIIATTFTNKAAAELRVRVRAHLIKQGQYTYATAIGQARIGTVNGVCGNLLARFAFEAGMPMEQRVLDEPSATQLLDEAIDEVIAGKTLTTLLTVARRLCLDEANRADDPWKSALRDIVSQARSNAIDPAQLRTFGGRNAAQLLALFPRPTTRDLTTELLVAIQAALPTIRQAQNAKPQKNTAKYLRELEEFERSLSDGHFHWAHWNRLSKCDPGAKLRAAAQAVTTIAGEHAKHPLLHQDVREYLETLFALGADVLEIYRERKRQMGAVDFTDQECELLKILNLPEVADTLTAELDLLMVDEFQDTSPIQLALFLKLAQCARHVVWVGDVKQAIYGFRGGDATLMSAVVNALPTLGGKRETLKDSWRSRAALVHFVNDVFGGAFAPLKAADVHLRSKRPEFQGTAAVEDWLLEGGNADDQYHGIAAGIATLINDRTQIPDPQSGQLRPLRLGDMAVLARSKNHVNAIAEVLQSQRIMASTEQPGLLNRPEMVLALACLRRLNDERDTIATAEIVSLAECTDPDVWLAERLAWIESGAPAATWRESGDAVHPIFRAIQGLREQLSHLSPQEAVHLLLARCDVARHVLQWQQSPERARLRLANLERLTGLAAEYQDACRSTHEAATISGLLLWLQELAASEADTMPQPPVDAVQVMTHHAAKGLEWPMVVLVDLASDVKSSIWDAVRAEHQSAFDAQRPLNDRFLRYWPWPYGAQGTVPVADVVEASPAAQVMHGAAVEEHKRLLYVSMTRARDILVLARQAKKPQGPWMDTVQLASFLPQGNPSVMSLTGGHTVPIMRRHLAPDSTRLTVAPANGDLRWFEVPENVTVKQPLTVNPSLSTPVIATLEETVAIGTRIEVDRDCDAAMLGDAVHTCLAAYLSTASSPPLELDDASFSETDVKGILDRMDVPNCLSPAAMLGQLSAVRQWLTTRWPKAPVVVEVPFTQTLAGGQLMNGRIDLLLKTDQGWILFDHKSGSQNSTQWAKLAASYGGQLAAYSDAIEQVTGIAVLETWLLMPVAGAALKVKTAPSGLFTGIAKIERSGIQRSRSNSPESGKGSLG
jgi:ATP-dependent helicase/nuclease subunit A